MRPRLPRNTIRLRLTLAYSVLFLVSGAALLGLIYVLAQQQYTKRFFISSGSSGIAKVIVTQQGGDELGVVSRGGAPPLLPSQATVTAAANAQSDAALHTLLVDSGIALAAMAVLSLGLGWVVAGRALGPLRTITAAARDISAQNLHRRLALRGPDDELKQLGTTFDGLLERLERAFEAQRQFVANASHELRTPLTYERTLLEVALGDRDADAETLRGVCERVLENGRQQERMIEALLTLSRSQRGLARREPADLADVARACLDALPADGPTLYANLAPAPTSGDPRLLERLAENLVANAVRYNVPGGWLEVATGTRDGRAWLVVVNTGPAVSEEDVGRIFEPFQRLDGARGVADGLGLGLSIVAAIATAHDATISTRPRDGGGLGVEVSFAAHPTSALEAERFSSIETDRNRPEET